MNKNNIQTKRGAGKKSGLKVLHAKTAGRRKQRAVAVTPADLGADVPNVGIGRALIVILVLHVVAIGAVIMHTSWTDGQGGGNFSGKTPAIVTDPFEEESNQAKEKPREQGLAESNNFPKVEERKTEEEEIPAAVVHSIRPTQAIEAATIEDEPVVKAVVVKPVKPNQSIFEYTIQKGDTIWGICNKHGMSADRFKEMNNLVKDVIKPGQKVIITK